MSYKVPGFPLGEIVASLWRMVVAVAIAGEVTWLVTSHVGATAGAGAWWRMIVGAIVGLVVYAVVLAVLKAPELTAARRRLAGRLRTTAA